MEPDENTETSRPAPTRMPTDSNPWADSAETKPNEPLLELNQPTHPPQAPTLEEALISARPPDLATGAITPPVIDTELLNEFDPLANQEEKEARDAWESSEAHPPLSPQTPSTPSPSPPDDIPTPPRKESAPPSRGPSPPPNLPSFPSLAALARTFQVARSRPLSFDTARSVPSPATLSAFASQQQQPQPQWQPAHEEGGITLKDERSEAAESGPSESLQTATKVKDENSFDFQKFLDQMKLKPAEPVAKYLRSFLSNFAKRTFTMGDQVKIINDFLNFIASRMRDVEIWRNASDAEFDNAMEGMEKLVMNRLYDFTFTPQVARAIPPRPITADDLERDRVLGQRIALFGWIEEQHLDIPQGEGSKGFLMFAQQELLKINHYKAPRDKLICILNCCKVIFGLIRHLHHEEGADSFVPILIYIVLKANPEHLLSNVEFINRFRNPNKLQSEAGYYLSSLMGAVSFIESMDHTSLSNITQDEFERKVEAAIQSLPETEPLSPSLSAPSTPKRTIAGLPPSPHAGEESAQPLALNAPQSLSNDARRLLQRTGDTISKPLSAIGRIFTDALDNVGGDSKLTYLPGPFAPFEIGRERAENAAAANASNANANTHWSHPDQIRQFTQGSNIPQTPAGDGGYVPPVQTPYKPRVRRAPSSAYSPQQGSPGYGAGAEDTPTRTSTGPYTNQPLAFGPSQALAPPSTRISALSGDGVRVSRTPTPALDFAAVQEQIDNAAAQAGTVAKETLSQIFPGTDSEVVAWVLEANDGDLGKSIEALLEMSSGS